MHLLIKVFPVKIVEYFSITRPLYKTILSFNFLPKENYSYLYSLTYYIYERSFIYFRVIMNTYT